MISFDALQEQNHNITELSNVLHYLVKDRSMCDTNTCCELFHRYLDELTGHIDKVERTIYPVILRNGGRDASISVNNFMNGSQEIKRIVKHYTRRWCKKKSASLHIADHDAFIKETGELFEVVLQRLQDEAEKLYPMARRLE